MSVLSISYQLDVLADSRDTSVSPQPASADSGSKSSGPAAPSEAWMQSVQSHLVEHYIEYLEAQPLSFTRVIVKTPSHAGRAVDAR